jgi:uncharacterized protein YdeI (BOF family)
MYRNRNISAISKSDSEIILVGEVVDKMENSFILKDDTGSIEIFSDEIVEKGKIVKVFCKLVDGKLKADIVQDLNNFDLNLYKKVKELYNKVGVEF